MNPDYWFRLVRVVRQAPAHEEFRMPYGFDLGVINRWKSSISASDGLSWLPCLRGALVCSTVIMLLCLAVNFQISQDSEPAAIAIADSAFRISLTP